MKGDRKIDDFINVRDYAPTFLELAGVEAPDSMTGKSFLDVLQSWRFRVSRQVPQSNADRQRAS